MSKDSDKTEPSIDDIVASIRRIISDEESRTRKPLIAAKGDDILELTDILNEDGSVTPLPTAAAALPSDAAATSDAATPEAAESATRKLQEEEAALDRHLPVVEPPKVDTPPVRPAAISELSERAVPPSRPMPGFDPAPAAPAKPPQIVRPAPLSRGVSLEGNTMTTQPAPTISAPSVAAPTLQPAGSPLPPSAPASQRLVSPQTAGAAVAAFDRLAQATSQAQQPPAAARPPASAAGGGKSVEDLVREMLRPILQQWMDNNLPGMVERLVQQEIQRLTRR